MAPRARISEKNLEIGSSASANCHQSRGRRHAPETMRRCVLLCFGVGLSPSCLEAYSCFVNESPLKDVREASALRGLDFGAWRPVGACLCVRRGSGCKATHGTGHAVQEDDGSLGHGLSLPGLRGLWVHRSGSVWLWETGGPRYRIRTRAARAPQQATTYAGTTTTAVCEERVKHDYYQDIATVPYSKQSR